MEPKFTFLLVNESITIRKIWGLKLAHFQAQIIEASSATEALTLFDEQRFDLILADCQLPQTQGIDFITQIRQHPQGGQIPFVAVQPLPNQTQSEKAYELGTTLVLTQQENEKVWQQALSHLFEQGLGHLGSLILVVDDSPALLRLVEAGLTKAGFQVVTACNGKEALEVLKTTEPAIIISDLDMPVMNGIEFCKALLAQEETRHIPFIILSANSEKSVMRSLIAQGASAYVVKPFHLEQFIITVEKALSEQFRLLDEDRKRLELERNSMLGSITALVNALEARDPYTSGHSQRVSQYAVAIGEKMGLSKAELETLQIGARLHDLGKIGIADGLLRKPGKLTAEEVASFNEHPMIGSTILTPIPSLAPIIPVVELHHERIDGEGYPKGLKGEKIPLMARICAVADCYDALTSDRPYRKGFPHHKAMDILSEVKGTQLCDHSVQAFTQWAEAQQTLPIHENNSSLT